MQTSTIKGVLLDLGGTVYLEGALLPGAAEALQLLRAHDIPYCYLTNSSRSPRTALLQKLRQLGVAVRDHELFTAPMAVRAYLLEHNLTPWLLVHPVLREEFAGCPAGTPNAVVLGDAADAMSYQNLNHAFRLLFAGARLLAVGDNRYFQEADGMSLDAGPFVRALEYAAGCEAIILGKPSPAFFHGAAAQLGCRPGEVLMVGDDVAADVNGALKAGMKAALVQTGKYRPGDEQRISRPGACVCADLRAAVAGIVG